MQTVDIAKAWKDKEYYNSLTTEQKNALPANPAGEVSISDDELRSVTGGGTMVCVVNTIQANTASSGCCHLF